MAMSIAILAAGGGKLALSPLPGREGSYAADLADLVAFAPALVLSMTTAEETAARGAWRLAEDLARHGIRWRHLPIADFGVPNGETAALWPAASVEARGLLAAGGRVLVHCMGGCGRSGMAVLRLMVETGEDPAAALVRLRAQRPCAVETPAQLDWAAGRAGAVVSK
ncbi:MAG: protein phosphatase [Rhodobacter sp.]|jgi:protein-tyrosine phosphatase|nr:protein phosphatase [Rhodobacter sp.]MBK8440347.1 protein phosphatase [Rhodobacter sp.]